MAKAFTIITILIVLGFGVSTFYGEKEAISKLEVNVYDAGISRIGFTSADIEFKLRFYNPTGYDTPTFWVEYDVYLDGNYIGHGNLPPTFVPAGSTTHQTATVTVSYAEVGMAVADALMKGKTPTLSFHGTVHAKIFFGLIPTSRPFSFFSISA